MILTWKKLKMWHQWTYFYEGLILWFYVEMLKKIIDVWSWLVSHGLWPWFNFMIFCWNVITRWPTNTWAWSRIVFKISSWNIEEIIWTWSRLILRFQVDMLRKISWTWRGLIIWFQVEMLRKTSEFDPGWYYDFKFKCWYRLVNPGWNFEENWKAWLWRAIFQVTNIR